MVEIVYIVASGEVADVQSLQSSSVSPNNLIV